MLAIKELQIRERSEKLPSACISDVQRVRLSLSSCIIRVESL